MLFRFTRSAEAIRHDLGTPCLIHQPRYNILDRWVEDGLLEVLGKRGIGCIAFSPLAQGLLTNRYLKDIPADSRVAKEHGFLRKEALTDERLTALRALNKIAEKRGQSLAQMSIAWLLKDARVTSVLVGASSVAQLDDNLKALNIITFSDEELKLIDKTSAPVMM